MAHPEIDSDLKLVYRLFAERLISLSNLYLGVDFSEEQKQAIIRLLPVLTTCPSHASIPYKVLGQIENTPEAYLATLKKLVKDSSALDGKTTFFFHDGEDVFLESNLKALQVHFSPDKLFNSSQSAGKKGTPFF